MSGRNSSAHASNGALEETLMSSLLRRSSVLLATLVFAAPALADPYDLIYTDRIDVTLCENGCGITLSGCDFAVLVNTGTAAITANEMRAARFTAASSESTITLHPGLNQYTSVLPDLEPGHARGGVCANNAFLGSLLLPGEVLENTAGFQFLYFTISRLGGTYEGPVTFDCTMDMAGFRATFRIEATLHLGPHAIEFLSGARVQSVPGPPPTITAGLDIRPGDCPNMFNPRSSGLVTMTVVGAPVVDVRAIEVASVRLEGSLVPVRIAIDDEVRAFSTTPCECNGQGADGYEDLSLKFTSDDVRAALGPTAPGGVAFLTVTGLLADGTPFEARDCLHVVGPSPPDSGIAAMVVLRNPSPGAPRLTYTLNADSNVDLAVYDVTGRRLESLVSARQPGGDHVAEWQSGSRPPGVYFFRLAAGGQVQMRRFVLLR
jgi:hypothetical protein